MKRAARRVAGAVERKKPLVDSVTSKRNNSAETKALEDKVEMTETGGPQEKTDSECGKWEKTQKKARLLGRSERTRKRPETEDDRKREAGSHEEDHCEEERRRRWQRLRW